MRNFLIICIDCLRYDSLNSAVQRGQFLPEWVAQDGITLRNCYATAPWTYPATNSLLTGRYPHRHGARHEGPFTTRVSQPWPLKFDSTTPSFFSLFKAAGYQTAGISTIFWALNEHCAYPGCDHLIRSPGQEVFYQNTSADWVVERFKALHDAELKGRSFAAYLHMIDLHRPLDVQVGQRFATEPAYDMPGIEDWDSRPFQSNSEELRKFRQGRRAIYEGALAYVGTAIHRLLSYLDANGVYDDTVVIITSDHGEEFWDHLEFQQEDSVYGKKSDQPWLLGTGHGHTLFEEQIHIPMLILDRAGGVSQRDTQRRTSTVDVLPTLLEIAGIDEPTDLDGKSINGNGHDWTLSEAILYGHEQKAIVSEQGKCIFRPSDETAVFYNLASDPFEKLPLPRLSGAEGLIDVAKTFSLAPTCRSDSIAPI